MLLTASQVSMVRAQASATVEAAIVVRNTLVTAYRHPLTRIAGRALFHTVMLCAAAAFFSGVLARRGWDAFTAWADQYVASCQVAESDDLPSYEELFAEADRIASKYAPKPVLLLPPAHERRHNATAAIVNTVLVTPPPAVIEPTAPAKRRGRPKGSKNRTKAA